MKATRTRIAVTTKTGDAGTSGLANGERHGKSATFFAVVGDLDELNSWVGLLAVKLGSEFPEIHQQLMEIQHTLFYIGAEVALSPKAKLAASKVRKIERWQRTLEDVLEPNWHTKFVLPGGTELGAYTDLARTVCRRVERTLVKHSLAHPLSPLLSQYLNRLSDYLYLLRCYLNQQSHYQEKVFSAG